MSKSKKGTKRKGVDLYVDEDNTEDDDAIFGNEVDVMSQAKV